jgi:hypothetical protein
MTLRNSSLQSLSANLRSSRSFPAVIFLPMGPTSPPSEGNQLLVIEFFVLYVGQSLVKDA